jgi:hypothetical protein
MNNYARTLFVFLWLAVLLGQAGYLSPENFLGVATTIMPFLTLALHWNEWSGDGAQTLGGSDDLPRT